MTELKLHFEEIIEHIVEWIEEQEYVVGCVYWLTNFKVLKVLSDRKGILITVNPGGWSYPDGKGSALGLYKKINQNSSIEEYNFSPSMKNKTLEGIVTLKEEYLKGAKQHQKILVGCKLNLKDNTLTPTSVLWGSANLTFKANNNLEQIAISSNVEVVSSFYDRVLDVLKHTENIQIPTGGNVMLTDKLTPEQSTKVFEEQIERFKNTTFLDHVLNDAISVEEDLVATFRTREIENSFEKPVPYIWTHAKALKLVDASAHYHGLFKESFYKVKVILTNRETEVQYVLAKFFDGLFHKQHQIPEVVVKDEMLKISEDKNPLWVFGRKVSKLRRGDLPTALQNEVPKGTSGYDLKKYLKISEHASTNSTLQKKELGILAERLKTNLISCAICGEPTTIFLYSASALKGTISPVELKTEDLEQENTTKTIREIQSVIDDQITKDLEQESTPCRVIIPPPYINHLGNCKGAYIISVKHAKTGLMIDVKKFIEKMELTLDIIEILAPGEQECGEFIILVG